MHLLLAKPWMFKKNNSQICLKIDTKMPLYCQSIFKCSYLRPRVEICKNSEGPHYLFSRDLGQWHLLMAIFIQSKWGNCQLSKDFTHFVQTTISLTCPRYPQPVLGHQPILDILSMIRWLHIGGMWLTRGYSGLSLVTGNISGLCNCLSLVYKLSLIYFIVQLEP